MNAAPLVSVENLEIAFKDKQAYRSVIRGVDFEVKHNEIVGIVGESGSGKSVTALALMGLLPKQTAKIESGAIWFNKQNLLACSETDFRKIRGAEIAMIFQEPMSSLNPSLTCGFQVEEMLRTHTNKSKAAIKSEVLQLFEKVKLPNPKKIASSYPHEISGGQKQRVMIAMAIACKPKLIIADEPTTALDVTVQKEIIVLLKALQQETAMSIIFVSHDLALVSEIAQQVLVMYQGKIVEQGTISQIFNAPQQDYTKALLGSRPSLDVRLKRLPTIQDVIKNNRNETIITAAERAERHKIIYEKPPLLEVVNLSKTYVTRMGFFGKKATFTAVDSVSFAIYEGETLGLVGESGCGKSTLGNAILLLDKATSGQLYYRGQALEKLSKSAEKNLRREIQIIFQDPYASLNPRIPVGKAIMEPMKVHGLFKNEAERKEKAIEILHQVGLGAEHFDRYPHEFSGGQRQRIGIARTIAMQPKLIVCDESVSALDISVQAQVLNVLNELKENFGFTYLFISHDLAVVKYMSDKVMVMNKGKIEELEEADALYRNPKSAYTQKLISAIPKGN